MVVKEKRKRSLVARTKLMYALKLPKLLFIYYRKKLLPLALYFGIIKKIKKLKAVAACGFLTETQYWSAGFDLLLFV